MNDERYQRVKQAFYEVCGAAPGERGVALERACDHDEDLRREVEQLLAVNERERSFLQQPVMDGERFRGVASGLTGEPAAPHMIGRYRILRLVGEGGMGCVYEAEQESPQRRVALKVVRPMLHSLALMQRFEHEVRILGRLQHPGIAQIFEAGIADAQPDDVEAQIACDAAADSAEKRLRRRRPFFAMEFVDGQPLTHFASRRNLSLDERLGLLVRVCHAVHYGHQRGVVHRDLKPANILVCDDGTPKVIDFGVARATDADPMLTLHTEAGQMLGTLAYMSPEQVSGGNAQVDARSDVYALGVIGYELISGRLPYDLAGHVAPEAARIICDNEPSRLSSVSRNYRGDIETIIAKALAKEPARRYASAEALAADISRYLRDEPIVARPPTLGYQLAKFARRHKEFVAGLVLVFIVLIAGIIGTTLALVHALDQRTAANNAKTDALTAAATARSEAERATAESRKAQRISQSMQRVLSFAAPGTPGGGRDVKVVQMLDAASDELLGQLGDAPEIEITLRRTLGETYARLGVDETAQRHYVRALELTVAIFGRESLEVYDLGAEMALAKHWKPGEGDLHSVRAIADAVEQWLVAARGKAPPEHPTIQRLLYAAGRMNMATWRTDMAIERLTELLAIMQTMPPDRRIVTELEVRAALVYPLTSALGFAEAQRLAREVLASIADAPPTVALNLRIDMLNLLGLLVENEQRLDEAAALFSESFALQRDARGIDHPTTLAAAGVLRGLMLRMHHLPEALAFNAIERQSAERGAPTADWLAYIYAYEGLILSRLGREDEASTAFEQAVAHRRRHIGDDWLVQEWWRGGVESAGGLFRPWTSETLRRFVWRHVEHALRKGPTTTFALSELDWKQARYVIERWDGQRVVAVAEGPFEQLRDITDPEPGLLRLTIRCPRSGGDELLAGGWLLAAPWRLDLFRAYRDSSATDQTAAILAGPHEYRQLPALAFEQNFVDALGPAGAQLCFDIHATAMVQLPAGRYRLRGNFDDGARLWLDGQLLFDGFDHASRHPAMYEAQVDFDDQPHELRVEYFQHGQAAAMWITAEPLMASSGDVVE